MTWIVDFDDPINHLVGKTPEEKFPRAVHMHRPTFGVVLDLSDSVIGFRNKSVRSGGIAIAIPRTLLDPRRSRRDEI